MRYLQVKILFLVFIFLPFNVFAIDAEYIEMNPFSGQLDATRTTSGIIEDLDPIYLRLNGTNKMTGHFCRTQGDGEFCIEFDSETVSLVINDTTRQTWITALVAVNYDFEDGTNYDFEDGTNYDFN